MLMKIIPFAIIVLGGYVIYSITMRALKKAEIQNKKEELRIVDENYNEVVQAGLTPLERATIEKETAIGVAEKLSQVKFPGMMVIGGGNNGKSAMNPFDAVGLESFINIQKKLSNSK